MLKIRRRETWGLSSMTVFDPSAVRRLEVDTESKAFVTSLAETYQQMLTPRVERLVDSALASDTAVALDAALSLRVSSIMIGATELGDLSTAIIADLKNHDLPAARAQALLLPPAAVRARAAIAEYLAESSGASTQESTDSIR